jgi:hypothetical protein
MDQSQMSEKLQAILEGPGNRSDQDFADTLNRLPPEQFDEIVNNLLVQISPAEVKEYGLAHFAELDRYPNPRDGLLEKEEVSEFFWLARTPREKAILVWIWLAFDEIRLASDDFEGIEKAYDVVLTLKDFQSMKV